MAKKMKYVLYVSGDDAHFRDYSQNPCLKTYPVMPPVVAKGIMETIYWHKNCEWKITKIINVNEPDYEDTYFTGFVNKNKWKHGRLVKTFITNPAYVIEAEMSFIDEQKEIDHLKEKSSHCSVDIYKKADNIIRRRIKKQSTIKPVTLGLSTCHCEYKLIDPDHNIKSNMKGNFEITLPVKQLYKKGKMIGVEMNIFNIVDGVLTYE